MLTETPTTRVRYGAGISATALAHPGAYPGYRTPSGALMGGVKSSLGCALSQGEANGTARLRTGPAVPEDYQLHEKGRLLGEAEALGALGESSSGGVTWDDGPAAAPASSGWGTWIGLAAMAALALSWGRK